MKILYYNWVQFDSKYSKHAGGVNVYQYNLIDELKNNPNYDLYFLSSGFKYNPFLSSPYIEETKNIFGEKCKTFEIINSPIISPAFAIYMNPKKFIEDEESYKIFKEFVQKYGPFDVIHFNNIEGISVNVLRIKKDFPKTKIIFSIHDYKIICPLVFHFQDNKYICKDFKNGEKCLNCASFKPPKRYYTDRCHYYFFGKFPVNLLPIFRLLIKIFFKLFTFKAKNYMGSRKTMVASDYIRYRQHNIEQVNKYVDVLLAVSDRTRQIMIEHGVNPEIIKTSYIGTKFSETELGYSVAPKSDKLTIAYLGQQNTQKGYYFLINALSKLDNCLKQNVNIVLAVCNIHKRKALKRLKGFNNITIYNGYKHEKLKEILSGVNLGIIPVLWEDNLPQIAIEMVAHGVPILCSSFGGASELCASDLFKFKGGNEQDFVEKISMFIKNPLLLDEYWLNRKKLTSMKQHIMELEKYYSAT